MINLCEIDDCLNKVIAKGLCHKHYKRAQRHGDPTITLHNYSENRRKRGEGWISPDGYKYVSVNGKMMREHRLVMQEILGRELLSNENVHHINGDKLDNRAENLELWVTAQPSGQRAEDLANWAVEILKLYRPTALTQTELK